MIRTVRWLPLLCLAACTAAPVPETDPLAADPVQTELHVVLDTTLGAIAIEVLEDASPISAADFLAHVDAGLYDGEGFYRVVRADNDPRGMGMSLIQGGILSQEMARPPIAHERPGEAGLSNTPGTVSIARLEPGTGSAGYFFINIGDNSFLDDGPDTRNPDGEGYAVFGRVIEGMDVVRAIQGGAVVEESENEVTRGQFLAEPVIITRAYRSSGRVDGAGPDE